MASTADLLIARARQATRAGRPRAHRYSADQYGLADEQIEDAFAGYVEAYRGFCRPETGSGTPK